MDTPPFWLTFLRSHQRLLHFIRFLYLFPLSLVVFLLHPKRMGRYLYDYFNSEISLQSYFLNFYGPQMLQRTIRNARESGLEPFLVWGSLLGFRRGRSIIKHDDDIDLGLINPDPLKIKQLIILMAQSGFTKKNEKSIRKFKNIENKITILGFQHTVWRTTTDFYFFYPMDRQFVYINSSNPDALVLHMFPEEILMNFEQEKFLDTEVLIPKKTDEFLTTCYGDWNTIQREKRPCLNTEIIHEPETY